MAAIEVVPLGEPGSSSEPPETDDSVCRCVKPLEKSSTLRIRVERARQSESVLCRGRRSLSEPNQGTATPVDSLQKY